MSPSFRRRTGLVLAAALSVVLGAAACSSSPGSSSSSSGGSGGGGTAKTTITFVGADPATAFAKVISDFEAKNPNITVKYQNIPFDQFNGVIQQRVGGKDPSIDVMYVDAGAVAAQAQRGWLTDLSSYKQQADQQSLAAAVAGNLYQGKLWALPMWTSAQYLYYNRDLLTKAGVTPPSGDPSQRWTWEQVVDAAKKAQAAGAQWGLLFDQTDRYYQLQALPESLGGGSGATGPDLLTAEVTNAGWQKSMQWYGSLFADKLSPRGVSTDQMNVLFSSGKAAFFVGGPWDPGVFKTANPKLPYGVAPHPYFAGGKPAMPTGSWSLAVSSASQKKDAAEKFVAFASLDPQGNAATTATIVIPPTNKQAFASYFPRLDSINPPATTGMGKLTLEELQKAAVNRPNTVGFTQMQDILGSAFADIRNGQGVSSTLSTAQQKLQSAWTQLK